MRTVGALAAAALLAISAGRAEAQLPFAVSVSEGGMRYLGQGQFAWNDALAWAGAVQFPRVVALTVEWRKTTLWCTSFACSQGVTLSSRYLAPGVRLRPFAGLPMNPWIEVAVSFNRVAQQGDDTIFRRVDFSSHGLGQVVSLGADVDLPLGLHAGPYLQLHRMRLSLDPTVGGGAGPAGRPSNRVVRILGTRGWTGTRVALTTFTFGVRITLGPWGTVSTRTRKEPWENPSEPEIWDTGRYAGR